MSNKFIIEEELLNLNIIDINNMKLVSKKYKNVIESNQFQKRLIKRDFNIDLNNYNDVSKKLYSLRRTIIKKDIDEVIFYCYVSNTGDEDDIEYHNSNDIFTNYDKEKALIAIDIMKDDYYKDYFIHILASIVNDSENVDILYLYYTYSIKIDYKSTIQNISHFLTNMIYVDKNKDYDYNVKDLYYIKEFLNKINNRKVENDIINSLS